MATANQYEVEIHAIRDAAVALAEYGSTPGLVTSSTMRSHAVTKFDVHDRLWSALAAGAIVGLPTPNRLPGDSRVAVFEGDGEVLVVARIRR